MKRQRLFCLLLCVLLTGCVPAQETTQSQTSDNSMGESSPVEETPPPDASVAEYTGKEQAAAQPVTGTVMYSFGNTVEHRRMSDYYIDSSESIQVFVDYPDYYQSSGNDVAELLRQAAYNGWTMEELADRPNTNVTVDYEITRADARYFSVAFLFYAYSQGQAYPASNEYAVTIDRTTASPVLLSDILEFDSPEELTQLIPEVFTPVGNWFDLPSTDELAACYTDASLFDESKTFYLTDDSLCLIVQYARYHFVLEAPLSSLPLKHAFET